jgi:hypothetical protein
LGSFCETASCSALKLAAGYVGGVFEELAAVCRHDTVWCM